jgi:hypothetical protein
MASKVEEQEQARLGGACSVTVLAVLALFVALQLYLVREVLAISGEE